MLLNQDRITEISIRLRIPESFHQEPIISHLISHYHLTVNIKAAILGANARGDGWFTLELRGQQIQIQEALTYLKDRNLEIWDETEIDGW